MVNFNRRFDPDHAELKRIVDADGVGKVELVQLTSRGPAVPPLEYVKVSGGQMRDQTVHFFDLARWIAGADPVEVFAAGSALADPRLALPEYDDVDTSVCVLKMPDGALVQIDNNRRTGYGYDERIEVLGSTGLVESMRHRARRVTHYTAGQVVESQMYAGWFERMQPTYALALDHFVQLLETGAPIEPSLSDGLKAQAIAEAATKSLHTGVSEKIAVLTEVPGVRTGERLTRGPRAWPGRGAGGSAGRDSPCARRGSVRPAYPPRSCRCPPTSARCAGSGRGRCCRSRRGTRLPAR